MQSIDLIRDNLQKSTERVLVRVEEMREHCLVPPTPRGGAHTLWVLGHLATIEGMVIHQFMMGRANPLAHWEKVFDGEEIAPGQDAYPPFDDVLAACREVRENTMKLLDSMSESDLDKMSLRVPIGAESMFDTRRLCFQFVADHWYMHRGQLADARRAAGVARMWY